MTGFRHGAEVSEGDTGTGRVWISDGTPYEYVEVGIGTFLDRPGCLMICRRARR